MRRICFIVLVCILASCSKNNDNKTENSCDRIVEILRYQPYGPPTYLTIATITYDQRGRVATVKGEGQNKSEYFYYSDSIVLKATDIYGTDIGETFYLDNKQRVIRTKLYNYDFNYDADGYMISYQSPYGYNGSISGYTPYYLKYESNNLTELYTTDQNVSKKFLTFEFYDTPNQDLMGFNSTFYLSGISYDRNYFVLVKGGYFGKQSKSLLKKIDFHSQYTSFTDIIYQYDAKGRIIGTPESFSFKYQCP